MSGGTQTTADRRNLQYPADITMIRPTLASALLFLAPALSGAELADTVIVDIHDRGAVGVEELKSQASVLWSVEFGNELLMAVTPESRAHWLARTGTRAGPDQLSLETLRIRDHACTDHELPPALAVVGGYEILRLESAWLSIPDALHVVGRKAPVDGVVAREVRNMALQRGTLAPDPAIQAVTARVDGARWFQVVGNLAGINRNSFSPQLTSARTLILNEFTAAGLTTEIFPFTLSSTTCDTSMPTVSLGNAIGRKTGASLPDEWIIVGAHYDARNDIRCDGSQAPQPGANDNASGCAGVIELARVFQGIRTERSVLFMCFAGEEQGLVGSRAYANTLLNSGDIAKVKHMINLDMIGHAIDDTLSARVETAPPHQAILFEYADHAATYAPELNLIISGSTGEYSDHWHFLQRGVPAAFTWENGAGIYPDYHQFTDVPGNMQRAQPVATGILKMDAAMIATLAGVYGLFGDSFE